MRLSCSLPTVVKSAGWTFLVGLVLGFTLGTSSADEPARSHSETTSETTVVGDHRAQP